MNGSVEAKVLGEELTVYPNPANQRITISGFVKAEPETVVELYTIMGQKVLEVMVKSPSASIDISTENLNGGLYLYKISSPTRLYSSGKIVVVH